MNRGAPRIDVIVPVYKGLDPTRRCIESALAARQKVAWELVVIDDASPQPELAAYLATLDGRPGVSVLRNESNLGFVATVNRGMALHPQRDVVLLNSDTEVAGDWLDRLHACARREARIGTVTPFSNNATICSYPRFGEDNPMPADTPLAELDAAFRAANAGRVVDIPTAVGFCMYIRRGCLDAVGPFDADRFGRGYGEENDFSLRAEQAGWRNVLCADTFVYHEGGVSFQAERAALQAQARATLSALHPDYDERVRRFIARDPVQPFRHAVDFERALRRRPRHAAPPAGSPAGGPVQTPANSTLPRNMKTIVRLSVREATAAFAAATLKQLLAGNPDCARILVSGDALTEIERAACAEAAAGRALEFVADGNPWPALAAAARETGAAGALLVAAGTAVPASAVLRLARVATDHPGVATVSPLRAQAAPHGVFDPAEPPLSLDDLDRLDRLAFLLGGRAAHEIGTFRPQCCYVVAAALDRMPTTDGLHVLTDATVAGLIPGAPLAETTETPGANSERPAVAVTRTRATLRDAWRAGVIFREAPGLDARPVQLHVIHDLGGGSSHWLRDYALADADRVNLVLRATSHTNASGGGLALYTHVLDESPLRTWTFARAIDPTDCAHLEYRAAIREILADHCVDAIVVSSLIGHALDILDTGLPTTVVCHDYFPYCPAINIHFDGVCETCGPERLEACFRDNPKFNPFVSFLPPRRLAVRERFLELARRPNVTLVAPSRSVEDNLVRLDARFGAAAFVVIPHGYGRALARPEPAAPPPAGRLRVLVLGQISVLKGLDLLSASLDAMREFADLYLVGCRELGELFRHTRGVLVVSQYDLEELPGHVAAINPHIGLLTSICPETFSYALTELSMLGVPALATRVGSFPERIRHQETGYLYEPTPEALIAALKAIDADRATLERVRGNLAGWQPRTAQAMVADFHRTLALAPLPAGRYPAGRPHEGGARDEMAIAQGVALSGMWKTVKSLHLQLSMSAESHARTEAHIRNLEDQARRADELRQQAENARALAEVSFDRQRTELVGQARTLFAKAEEAKATLAVKDDQLRALAAHAQAKTDELDQIRASTSWKLSGPVRAAGRLLRKTKTLGRYVRTLLRHPAGLRKAVIHVAGVWRAHGSLAVRRRLRDMQAEADHQNAWRAFHRTFARDVKPRIAQRIREMAVRPRISVLVPTYNTPEPMLRGMIDSVRNQLYPDWQLCIADDGSSQPHVRRVLEEVAGRDARIRLHLATENRGVSHASNRALELADGDFVVLLDHDDLLEEQALYRVAEAIVADDPDMVYSDEVMVSADESEVQQYAFRPAFSPELLRGHPYFVHLLGFRRALLRAIGGFDETLRISQDYDLMLRASEQARTIAHIPEILYRWRIHGGSSGQQRMREVMETSKAVLRRHLERCGEAGRIEDGTGFNLFDARYPLRDGLRVAIVIPTKNHGELVRQCIDSLHATISEVPFDILVVDHDSDDPDTLAYFASLGARARVLRYSGPFNFSAINNWAVAHLDTPYTHILLCNNDIEAIHPGWLGRMLELGQHPDVGIVGAQLLYPDGISIQHAGVCVGTFGAAEHFAKFIRKPDLRLYLGFSEIIASNHEVSAVTAACLLIRKDAFDGVHGFDETLAVGFGDIDLCLRVGQKGYRILQCPHAELLHHESFTRGKSVGHDPHPQDSALFRARWQSFLEAGDPHFNPNLSLNSTAWQMGYPIRCEAAIRPRIFEKGVPGRTLEPPGKADAHPDRQV